MTISVGRSEKRTRGRIEAEGKVRQDLRQSASRELSNVSEDDQVFRYRQLPFTVFRTFENPSRRAGVGPWIGASDKIEPVNETVSS